MDSFPRDIDLAFWKMEYERIVDALSLDPQRDREATLYIHSMFESRGKELNGLLGKLEQLILDRPVAIFGCGPSLDYQLYILSRVLCRQKVTKIAADGATSALTEAGLRPDVIVTDLDGYMPDIITNSRRGTIIVLHAHGDNGEAVARWLPELNNVLPVTQTEPTSVVRNFGGFTDGDKCLFMSSAFEASAMILVGMEFGGVVGLRSDPNHAKQRPEWKLAKLAIGKELSEGLIGRTGIPCYCLPPSPFKGVQEIDVDQIQRLLGG